MEKDRRTGDHPGKGDETPVKHRRHRHIKVAACLFGAWAAFAVTSSRAVGEELIAGVDLGSIVRAIYIAEGGDDTRFPYGIVSVKTKSKLHAKTICENTVRNSHIKWVKLGKKGDFIQFLGSTYCPPSVDPVGHKNWVRNVTLLAK